VWDCCAAPGGKTMLLAKRLSEADVLATDLSSRRLGAMEERVRREAPEARIRLQVADATELAPGEGDFDVILCDVPCSGTGTLARNPEIRHRLRPSDLARQAERQKAILQGAIKRLSRGKLMLYSTCSVEIEENEQVVNSVLSGAVVLEPVENILEELRRKAILRPDANVARLARDGFLRTLPGVGFRGDGFFAALLRRI
jgi:16S rRNA (cytosine967-C5)-methyltransferase